MEAFLIKTAYCLGGLYAIVLMPTLLTLVVAAIVFIPFRKKHYWKIVISAWFVFCAQQVFKGTFGHVWYYTSSVQQANSVGGVFSLVVAATPIVLFALFKRNTFRWIYGVVVVIFMGLLTLILDYGFAPQTAEAPCFHSERNCYSLTIPDNWAQIPDEVVRDVFNRLVSQNSASFYYEAAFQCAGADRWFKHPYVINQVTRYSDIGLARQPSETECKKYAAEFAGTDANQIMDKVLSAEAKEFLSDISMGEVYWDSESRTYTVTMKVDTTNIGEVVAKAVGHFGRHVIVQVMFYDLKAHWDKAELERDLILGSFIFDPEMAYRANVDDLSCWEKRLYGAIGRRTTNAAIILAIAVVSVIFTLLKRKQERAT